MDTPMTFILIEDNAKERKNYEDYFATRDDIKLVEVTDSSEKGIELVKTHLPEAIILDIELNFGSGIGSGIEFLEELNKIHFDIRPLIGVITHIHNPDTYNHAHLKGANFVSYKLKAGYSPRSVVGDLFLMRKSRCNINTANENTNTESIGERRKRISDRIYAEMNRFGIRTNLKGRDYVHDAVLFILEEKEKEFNMTAFQYLAKENNKGLSSISGNIQTVIEYAWDKHAPEEIVKIFDYAVGDKTGIPTPTEFVYYFVDKIKRSL